MLMNDCEVCTGAAFVNVEATRYSGHEEYLRPFLFCFEAHFCPYCGKPLKAAPAKVGGNDA